MKLFFLEVHLSGEATGSNIMSAFDVLLLWSKYDSLSDSLCKMELSSSCAIL